METLGGSLKRDSNARAKAAALLEFVGIGLTDGETEYLMQVLRLPLSYFAAVRQVVEEGRWRTSNDPLAYVRTAAWRTGIRDSKWDRPQGVPVPANMSHHQFVDLQTSWSGPVKKDGAWRGHSFYDDDDDYWQDGLKPGERLRNRVPEQFSRYWPTPEEREEMERFPMIPLPVDPIRVPDWDAIAKAAGLDRDEAAVLELRAQGLNRAAAMAWCETDAERKRVQAAWRRFDRKQCLERVRKVLTPKKYFSV